LIFNPLKGGKTMKTIFLVLAAAVLICAPSYAQDNAMQPVTPTDQEVGIMSFTGAIDSVACGDTTAGSNPQISLTSEDGNTMSFTLSPDTMIMGSEGNVITAKNLKKKSVVSVEYTMLPSGENKVMSVQED